MQKTTLYPLLLEPTLHVKVWGGRRLQTLMHKPLPTDEPYGEAWEMHDSAKVVNGALAGQTLGELLAIYGRALIGGTSDPKDGLPLLVKLLDATDWLSVQVHPNDDQARQLEGEPRGKTEAWYVIAAEADAQLVIGVKPGTTPAEVSAAIADNRLEGLLVYAHVGAGDVLSIPAGTIHALGPGLLVYEIQQSSDTTYRLYDWGRLGLDGKPRPLHVEKSVAVARMDSLPPITHPQAGVVIESPFFETVLHTGSAELETRGFHSLTCVEGEFIIEAGDPVLLTAGRTAFIPATLGRYIIRGAGKILRSYQNV